MTVPEVALLAACDALRKTTVNAVVPYISSEAGGNDRVRVVNGNTISAIPEESLRTGNCTSASECAGIESSIPSVSLRTSRSNTGNDTSQTNENVASWASVACAWGLNASTDGDVPSISGSTGLNNLTSRALAGITVPDVARAA